MLRAGRVSECGRVVAKEGAADDGDRRVALAHEVVVKLAEGESCALFFANVVAEFHDLQLAERVVKLGRVGRA